MNHKILKEKVFFWDITISKKVNNYGGRIFTRILTTASFLGRETIWLLLLEFFLLIYYNPFFFSYIGITYFIGLCIVVPIKQGLKRKRPFRELGEIKVIGREPSTGSFPSWHCYNVMSQGLTISLLLDSYIFFIISIIFIGIIGFSRIQMGVHYFTDVIGGISLGIIGFFLSYYIVGPQVLKLVLLIEGQIPYEIEINTIQPLFYGDILYFILCLLIALLIIILGFYKEIKKLVGNK